MQPLVAGSLVVGSYLLGSVPFGLLLGLSRGVDIRKCGSGNIGATNLGRVLGRRWAVAAFLLDFAKGLLPVLIAHLAWPDQDTVTRTYLTLGCGLAAILGHILPIWLRFRGGKGVATTFGALTALAWLASVAAGLVWLALYGLTRVVSIASIGAAVSFPLGVWWTTDPTGNESLATLIFSIVVALAIIVRHRSNIARILRGEELGFRKDASRSSAPREDEAGKDEAGKDEAGKDEAGKGEAKLDKEVEPSRERHS